MVVLERYFRHVGCSAAHSSPKSTAVDSIFRYVIDRAVKRTIHAESAGFKVLMRNRPSSRRSLHDTEPRAPFPEIQHNNYRGFRQLLLDRSPTRAFSRKTYRSSSGQRCICLYCLTMHESYRRNNTSSIIDESSMLACFRKITSKSFAKIRISIAVL